MDANTILIPLVEGNEVGTTFTLQTGHSYILRIHVHSSELQRMLNSYFSYGSNGPAVYGGGTVQSPLQLLFELQDMALLPYVNIGSTILYDGGISTSPAIASFACVNSLNLQGNIGYFKVTQPGTMWVVSTPAAGTLLSRAELGPIPKVRIVMFCRNGFLHFYKLAIPQPGEMLAVTYRVAAPSVARFTNDTVPQQGARALLLFHSGWDMSFPRRREAPLIVRMHARRSWISLLIQPPRGRELTVSGICRINRIFGLGML